jgi:hypothetical protein
LPACLRAGYNIKVAAGRSRRRVPGHPDPAVRAVDRLWRNRRRFLVKLYAGAFFGSCWPPVRRTSL